MKKLVTIFIGASLNSFCFSSSIDYIPFSLDIHWENNDVRTLDEKKVISLTPEKSIIDQVCTENCIYEIRNEFDLKGEKLTIPKGCILRFDGGCIKNGVLIGNNTSIACNYVAKIFDNIEFAGLFESDDILSEWFGAKGDGISDDYVAIQNAVNFANFNTNNTVLLLRKTYKINNILNIINQIHIKGVISQAWNYRNGTVLLVNSKTGVCISDAKYVHIESLKIVGASECTGIEVLGKSYGFFANQVFISDCKVGFHIGDSWNYRFDQCRVEGGKIGFQFDIGTSATIESCVAYNCTEYGFWMKNVVSSALIGSVCDGCKVGFT